ncbi:hypothetical protein AALC25_02770 [Lachnospiraceae bacterium 29-84]
MLKHHLFIVIGQERYNPLGVIRSLGQARICLKGEEAEAGNLYWIWEGGRISGGKWLRKF